MKQVLASVVLAAVLLSPLAAEDGEKKAPANVGGVDEPGATITGIVKFKGPQPVRKPLDNILGNAYCSEACKSKAPLDEKWVFGKNGDDDTFVNVLVYVSKGLQGKFAPPKEPKVLDQVGCVYTPHVVAVMAGQTLEIRNSDATLHNVMSAPRNNPAFNFGMPVKDQKVEKVFKEPETKMNLKCFMHPWMSSYVHVLEHPFFAVTGADGTFTIRGLPPGEYELSVLHETSLFEPTPATAKVTATAGGKATADFTYQPRPAN